MDKKSILNDLYYVSLVGVFAVSYSMKKKQHSIRKFDLIDVEK